MRRKSLSNNQTFLSRISGGSISKTIETSPSYQSSSFEQYHQQITRAPLIKFKTKKPSPISKTQINKNAYTLNEQLRKAKQQLVQIRKQIKTQHKHTEKIVGTKMQRLVSAFKDNLSQKYGREYSSLPQQQIYYPVPMPMPYPYMVQNHAHTDSNKQLTTFSTYYKSKDTVDIIRDKFKDKEFKAARKRKNMNKWRKATNCILFIIYLKKFCKQFQKARKAIFSKFINKFKDISKSITNALKQNLSSFFRLLEMRKDVEMEIGEEDRKEMIKEKHQLIKNVIKMILQAIMKTVQSNQVEIGQYCYLICHHGSYACTYPFLTQQQLELCCISQAFSYISAEKHLERVAIINLIFIKTIIANLFLSQTNLSPNLYYLSSVLYEFLINIQDEYLTKVPKSYQIGNFESFSFVKKMDSIVLNEVQHKAGQIISGLKGEYQVKRSVRFDSWNQQKKMLAQIVNTIWTQMKNLHIKLMHNYY